MNAYWLPALPLLLAWSLVAWLVATLRRNVGLVDIFWSQFVLLAALSYLFTAPEITARGVIVVVLASLWALRLAVHLGARNWNAPEDRRYVAIRARNEPGFTWKSLYLVFGLQGVLAFIVSAPLYAAISAAAAPVHVLDWLGVVLVAGGLAFETIADAQLARFLANPANRGKVMDQGLWRYSRHPNYFGEFCIWWGFFLIALAADGWWSIVSPLLMSVLLLRVSGVTLLEKDMPQRRPGYEAYARRTNAFFPGPVREAE
jgi:steroid 5-alpha reductase family enzyme